jgi:hypothetical protein
MLMLLITIWLVLTAALLAIGGTFRWLDLDDDRRWIRRIAATAVANMYAVVLIPAAQWWRFLQLDYIFIAMPAVIVGFYAYFTHRNSNERLVGWLAMAAALYWLYDTVLPYVLFNLMKSGYLPTDW